MSNQKKHNVIIIGSGLVGMILALSLAKKKISVTIIEKNKKSKLLNINDLRTSAISQGSSRILSDLKVWDKLKSKAQEINSILVKDGKKSKINFDSKSTSEGPLGFIIENKILKEFIFKEIMKSKFIKFFYDVKINEIDNKNEQIIKLKTDKGVLESSLLVGADGRYSKIRELSNLKYSYKDYNQKALVFNIFHQNSHNSSAVEYFFPSGPLALLPMKNKNKKMSSVVWTIENSEQIKLKKKEKFVEEFEKKYNHHFGKIKFISTPIEYNLNVFYCYKYFTNRIVLVGDACQAIHPIAGQGLNLGIRDALTLADTLEQGKNLGLDLGDNFLLKKYSRKRMIDKNLLVQSTHNLNKLFSNNLLFLSILRKLGMRIFNKSSFLKKQSMLFAMGLSNFDF